MSIFHFKGSIINRNSKTAFYQYYPEYLSAAEVVGEFKIDIETWRWEITKKAESGLIIIMPSDEKVVSSLTFKIRKFFKETKKFPKEVVYIA